jgi:hypothetical protein
MNRIYNIEQLTTNPELISKIREAERIINHNLNEAERLNNILDNIRPMVLQTQDQNLTLRALQMIEQAQNLNKEAGELHESVCKVMDDLRSRQNTGGRIIRKVRRTNK